MQLVADSASIVRPRRGVATVDVVSGRYDLDVAVEFGSVTKVVTATLLDELERVGQIDPDGPLEEYLPVPAGTKITPRLLVQHRSGLQRLPPNIPVRSRQPYAAFDDAALEAVLQTLPRWQVGQVGRTEYSNLGYAVLGAALAAAGGAGWFTLAQRHVLLPLGLVDVADSRPSRSLVGLGLLGRERGPWIMHEPLRPVGGLWGSVRDMLGLLDGLVVKPELGPPSQAWQRSGSVLWHNGATRDAAAVVAADTDTGGAVVLHTLGVPPEKTDARGVALLREHNPA